MGKFRDQSLDGWCMHASVTVLFTLLFFGGIKQAMSQAVSRAGVEWFEQHEERVEANYEKHKTQLGGNTKIAVYSGDVVADAENGIVTFPVVYTGLHEDDIAEFLIIGPQSDKDYESVSVAYATPQSIGKALRFIGLTPGRGAYENEQGYPVWPKTELVRATVFRPGETPSDGWPLGMLVADKENNTTLADLDFAFVDSQQVKHDGDLAYAADVRLPMAIVACYSEQQAVLQLPHKVTQGEAYGRFRPNLKAGISKGDLLFVHVTKSQRALTPLDMDVLISVGESRKNKGNVNDAPLVEQGVTFELKADKWPLKERADRLGKQLTLPRLLSQFEAIREAGYIPYTTVFFDESMRVNTVKQVAHFLADIDKRRGIHVEAPEHGQLYYDAFIPDPKWRKPQTRMANPWEVWFLEGKKQQYEARLIEADWSRREPKYEIKKFSFQTRTELHRILNKYDPEIGGLLVFVRKNTTYGELIKVLKGMESVLFPIFVFVEEN